MARVVMTPDLARAAAWDAANRSMRAGGRIKWNEDDYNVACETQARLGDYCVECGMDRPTHWPTCERGDKQL